MERARLIPCPDNDVDCKYRDTPEGCHLSEHHIFPRRTANSATKRRFGNLAINKVVSCRMIHDILDTFPPPEYPEVGEMKAAISEQGGQ